VDAGGFVLPSNREDFDAVLDFGPAANYSGLLVIVPPISFGASAAMVRLKLGSTVVFSVALLLAAAGIASAGRAKAPAAAAREPAREVEMFAAMESGDIEVKLIPRNDREANVLVTNKTKQPLSVQLPEAFAGVPVLAQIGGGNNNNNNNNNNNSNQSLGGGFGGGGGGGGGGFFSVPAEKVKQVKVATVCLEHGKRDPKANVPYEIRPIASYTSDAKLHAVLKLLGSGQVNQRAAQVATWHLANNMSWEQLAAKQIRRLNGAVKPYFSLQEMRAAVEIVRVAERLAAEAPSQNPASTSTAVPRL